MKNKKRRILLIDRPVQGELIRRVLIYWLLCMLVVTNMAICWLVVPKNPTTLAELTSMTYGLLGPVLTTSLFVLPLIVLDCVRTSNRFAGPVYRLHREIKRLADGKTAERVTLRKGDHWHDVAQDFNRMLDRFQQDDASLDASNDEHLADRSRPTDATVHATAS